MQSATEHFSKRILIADDLPSARRILKSLLQRLGFNLIDEAASGKIALERLQVDRFDVVISDWEMPDMTGLELLNAIRKSKDLNKLPVIMVTSSASREAVIASLAAGVTSYILKPFNHESLLNALNQALEAPEKKQASSQGRV